MQCKNNSCRQSVPNGWGDDWWCVDCELQYFKALLPPASTTRQVRSFTGPRGWRTSQIADLLILSAKQARSLLTKWELTSQRPHPGGWRHLTDEDVANFLDWKDRGKPTSVDATQSIHQPAVRGQRAPLADSTQKIEHLFGFHGRQDQLAQMDKWFQSDVPLACVTGLTGIGKTWLVQEWLAQSQERAPGFTFKILDAGRTFGEADPEGAVHLLLDRLARILLLDPIMETDEAPEDLATRARQSQCLLVVDNGETLLHPTASRGRVGVPSELLQRFLTGFVGVEDGPGRLVFISQLQPQGILEADRVQRGHVQVIGGQGRDPFQMPGFGRKEGIAFLERRLEDRSRLGTADIDQVVARFEGHPKGLEWFSLLTPELRREFVVAGPRQPLDHTLFLTLSRLVDMCSPGEIRLLMLVAMLRRPETATFLKEASSSGMSDVLSALDGLRRRSLIQHEPSESAYSAHGIVTEWHNQVHRTRLPPVHSQLAAMYVALDSKEGANNPETALLAAYHANKAGDLSAALQWRNLYTRRILDMGSASYHAGRLQESLELLQNFLVGLSDLPSSTRTPIYQSQAFLHMAVCLHHLSCDFSETMTCIHQALDSWPANVWACSFYPTVLSAAVAAQAPTKLIDAEFEQAVKRVQVAFDRSELPGQIETALFRLLVMWGTTVRKRADEVFHSLSALLVRHLPDDSRRLDPSWVEAALRAYTFVTQRAPSCGSPDDALGFSTRAVGLAEISEIIDPPADLQFARARAYTVGADFLGSEADRVAMLEEAHAILCELTESAVVKRGLVRELASTTLSLCRHRTDDGALALIAANMTRLQSVRHRFTFTPPIDAEFRAAEINLQRYMYTRSDNIEHLQKALAVAREAIGPTSCQHLTAGLAEEIVAVFGDSFEVESEDCSDQANAGAEEPERFRIEISRDELETLDRKLRDLSERLDAPELQSLRLRLRTVYLRGHWTSPPHPPRVLPESRAIAHALLIDFGQHVPTLRTVLDFWRLVTTHSADETGFQEAVHNADEVLQRLSSAESRPGQADLRRAHVLRAVLDYNGARQSIRAYLGQVHHLRDRRKMLDLYLDVVAHTIHWARDSDSCLTEDARQALALYREELRFQGIAEQDQDLSDPRAARRSLWALRCEAHLGELDPGNFRAIEDAMSQLRFHSSQVENAQVIGELSGSSFPLARMLGNHWDHPAMWREVGTWVSSIMGARPEHRDHAMLLWRISRTLGENVTRWRTSGHRQSSQIKASAITQLNLARWLLNQERGSEEWREGRALLQHLEESRQMTWLYRRFVLELLHSTADS